MGLAHHHPRVLCDVLPDEHSQDEEEREGRLDEGGCEEGAQGGCRECDLVEPVQ